jgi:hypothetical protein
MRNLVLFLAVGVILSGCYSKEYNEPGKIAVKALPTEMVIPGVFQRTWAATQTVLAKFAVVQKDIDPASARAYLVTDWTKAKSDVLYHGFGEDTRVPYSIRYKLYVYLVSEAKGGTRVTITSEEQYYDDFVTAGVDPQGSLYSWIATKSSTLKENRLLTEIDKLVRDPEFKPESQAAR